MRYREPFTLYPRKTGKKTIWYYRVYDEYGQRSAGRSTGHTNPTKARQHVVNLIRQGEEIPRKEITPADIDKLVLHLKEKHLANKTVNNIVGTLSVMLREAIRRGFISTSPLEHMRPLRVEKPEKGILSDSEESL